MEQRQKLNAKILYLVENHEAELYGITPEDIFNVYMGNGGLHGLDRKDFQNFHAYTEAKKEVEQGQFFTPAEICEFLVACVKPETEDVIYDLDYVRTYHPSYEKYGGVPAIEEVQFSVISCRGCFGSCSFCAIHSHQGRIIQTRSHESIIREAKKITELPNFKGYIHDVGGPTANFRHPSCAKQLKVGVCRDRQCLFPKPCPNLDTDHSDYIALLQKVRALSGIKKVFVRSGIRYDYLLADKNDRFLDELCRYHVSGQLKVAPEHVAEHALANMGKPGKSVYLKFMRAFNKKNQEIGLKQFLVPYFISSHPGCTLRDAVELSEFLRDIGHQPEQVQDFIPTPGSASTAMYYSGINPETGKCFRKFFFEKVFFPKLP